MDSQARRGEQRPLSIPAVRDRVVQAAVKIVIEPIFEADFQPCSLGSDPSARPHDALQVLIDEAWRGRRWVVETDIASCFEAIPHDRLMQAVEERICDRQVLKLLRAMLAAGVMEDGVVHRADTGTPARWGGFARCSATSTCTGSTGRGRRRAAGYLVRYADDLVVMCATRQQAEQALGLLPICWPIWAWSPRHPRPGSCTWRREARDLISSASITAGCGLNRTTRSTGACSSPAGRQTKRCRRVRRPGA